MQLLSILFDIIAILCIFVGCSLVFCFVYLIFEVIYFSFLELKNQIKIRKLKKEIEKLKI